MGQGKSRDGLHSRPVQKCITNLMELVITGNLTLNSNSIECKDWECHTGDHIRDRMGGHSSPWAGGLGGGGRTPSMGGGASSII